MDPPAAAICAEMLGVKTVIPIHYRTQEYLEQFQQYLAVRCPESVSYTHLDVYKRQMP